MSASTQSEALSCGVEHAETGAICTMPRGHVMAHVGSRPGGGSVEWATAEQTERMRLATDHRAEVEALEGEVKFWKTLYVRLDHEVGYHFGLAAKQSPEVGDDWLAKHWKKIAKDSLDHARGLAAR